MKLHTKDLADVDLSSKVISDAEKIVLLLVTLNGKVYMEDLVNVTGKSNRQIIRILNNLEKSGDIRRIKGRAGMTVVERNYENIL